MSTAMILRSGKLGEKTRARNLLSAPCLCGCFSFAHPHGAVENARVNFLRIGRVPALIALFGACGGHWLALQSIAWARMVRDYTRAAGMACGVARTFDGAHPCALCTRIAKEMQSEKKQQAGAWSS